MDDDDFKDWTVCWRVNLHFHTFSKNLKCIVCSEVYAGDEAAKRSNFWQRATNCSVGHGQATPAETRGSPRLGICGVCDQRYIFDVLRGRYTCRREGCRRVVRVNEVAVRDKLTFDKGLLTKFLKLVEKCRVYECAIHCDEVPYGASFFESVKPPTSQCNHDCTVCDMCLKSTFESAIRGSASQNLACPDPECKAILPLDRVKKYVSKEVFKIYNDQLAIKATSQFENFRWCDCGHGQIHEPESNPEWKCLRCKKRNCYICLDDSTRTCDHLALIDAKIAARKEQQRLAALRALAIADQEDEWAREAEVKEREDKRKKAQENEVANKATAARISKLCPKVGCGTRIKRISHCAHFTCISCHTHFCWCCKAIWSNGRRIHVTGCKFGTGSTVAKSSLNKSQYARDWDKDLGYDLTLDKDLYL